MSSQGVFHLALRPPTPHLSQRLAKSQYAAAAHVPLIKSPSLRVPRPIEMPADTHPLPDSVTPYFVYPFTLEPHLLALESARRQTLAAHAARREALLRARDDEHARRRREALRRIAPGFEPAGAPLVPTKTGAGGHLAEEDQTAVVVEKVRERDVMDDLVDRLAEMDGAGTR
ncbi:hypothetical protein OF83DRAFT_1071656 [Amylostereum chailletii]|nr:hypothetical protein OF83DRAFT_1071656 [Amylostereum chailletii]